MLLPWLGGNSLKSGSLIGGLGGNPPNLSSNSSWSPGSRQVEKAGGYLCSSGLRKEGLSKVGRGPPFDASNTGVELLISLVPVLSEVFICLRVVVS